VAYYFVNFATFVEKVSAAGEGKKKVFFTESSNNRKFILEIDEFDDYCFQEIT